MLSNMNEKIIPKVVFIMGAGHCGSTLIDLIMGSHSQSFSLGELQRIHSSIDTFSKTTQICGVCVGHCPFWNDKAQLSLLKLFYSKANRRSAFASKLSQCLYNPYKLLSKWSNKSILIDSSKRPGWIQRQLRFPYRWLGIKPYLLYMVRDGRAVVSSYRRKYDDKDLVQIIDHWKQETIKMNRFYEQFSPNRRVTVHYEDLATQPEKVVKSLCNSLDIEFEPAMLNYWAGDHHHLYGNGGTRALIYRYRDQQQQSSPEQRLRAERAKEHYKYEYYDQVDISIKLDERWRTEMSEKDLSIFEDIAGDLNRSLLKDN